MKTIFVVGGFAMVAYLILGKIREGQISSAIAACGGPQAVTLASATGGCPQEKAVFQKWAWYPTLQVSL